MNKELQDTYIALASGSGCTFHNRPRNLLRSIRQEDLLSPSTFRKYFLLFLVFHRKYLMGRDTLHLYSIQAHACTPKNIVYKIFLFFRIHHTCSFPCKPAASVSHSSEHRCNPLPLLSWVHQLSYLLTGRWCLTRCDQSVVCSSQVHALLCHY